MKKIVISGYYGFKNFGDEAILSVLIDKLKTMNIDITVFSSDAEYTSKTYSVKSVNTFDYKNVIAAIKDSDILISGGGSLLQDVTSIKSLLYYCWVIYNALWNKKKIIIFAQGIGPINSIFAKFIVKNLLKKCEYVSVRDENSQNLLNSWNIKNELLCDPIFSLNVNQPQTKPIVGVQLRDFKTMNDTLLNKLAESVVKEFNDKAIEIYSLQDSLDLSLCIKFSEILKTLDPSIDVKVFSSMSVDEVVEKFSHIEYMIAMRFHAILVALKYGIKTIAINYDSKVEKLAKDFSIPLISMNANENFDELFNELKNTDSIKLKSFADKCFNWNKIEEIISIV